MEANLSITSPGRDDEFVFGLTRDLLNTLNKETEIKATLKESPPAATAKGDMTIVGTIVLTIMGGGGVAVALVNVLKSYVERGHPLDITLERKDGEKLSLKSGNFSAEQLTQVTKLIHDFFKGFE